MPSENLSRPVKPKLDYSLPLLSGLLLSHNLTTLPFSLGCHLGLFYLYHHRRFRPFTVFWALFFFFFFFFFFFIFFFFFFFFRSWPIRLFYPSCFL